jgi:hypothetical protein
MKVADDQLFKQENCTKREEFNALRIVIPSLRIDTEKESKPAEMFSIHGESRKEGILILPGHCEKTLLTNSSLSLLFPDSDSDEMKTVPVGPIQEDKDVEKGPFLTWRDGPACKGQGHKNIIGSDC